MYLVGVAPNHVDGAQYTEQWMVNLSVGCLTKRVQPLPGCHVKGSKRDDRRQLLISAGLREEVLVPTRDAMRTIQPECEQPL